MRPSLRMLTTLAAAGLACLAAEPVKDATRFFPPTDPMAIGVYYYPEQWSRNQWRRDLGNIAKLGFTFTHLAEFAWSNLEPEEGRYEFEWLDEAISLAAGAGLKVILCTPSAAPPAWMGAKYPEIYLAGPDGVREHHGTRSNGSLSNPRFHERLDKVVAALAQRYGRDPRVWGWQVDNEPGAFPDYSPSAREAFHRWLQQRYGTIDRLNEAWGGSFWSLHYDTFDQVVLPYASPDGEKTSPHALLDFQRFTADTQAAFLDRQAAIIKRHALPSQWVTTNYRSVSVGCDPRRTKAVDFATFTYYPVAGNNPLGGQTFRIGNPAAMAEACDFYRPVGGVTGVMELQPGQVNWAATNPKPAPGAVRMWMWHAFGGGCSFVCTYRYRQPRFGSEMYHEGIVGLDGLTLSQGGTEFTQVMGELARLKPDLVPGAPLPAALAARRTAVLWSQDVMWDLDIQKQSGSWSTLRHRNRITAAVKSTGAPMAFISEADDFSPYPFLVAPAYQLADEALVARWKRYAEAGGHLVLTCRTAQKGSDSQFPEAPLGSRIRDLIGARLEGIDALPADVTQTIRSGAQTFPWRSWGDLLRPDPGTTTLATFQDGFYAGAAAAVTRRLGKGTVTYLGVDTLDGALETRILRGVFEAAGVAVENLPKGVYAEWRDGCRVAVNYSSEAAALPIPKGSRILLGSTPLQPAQVLVWKEEAAPARK